MKRNNRKKRNQVRNILLIAILVLILIAVGAIVYITKDKKAEPATNSQSETVSEVDDDTAKTESEASSNEVAPTTSAEPQSAAELTFADLSKYYYEFCSGAGGWNDEFNIEPDGYFHGKYHDSDMGDTGDDYPDGTMYVCNYSGYFEGITQIDEHTYTMKIKEIHIDDKETEEYIDAGTRYIPAAPYALDSSTEVQIYLPGKPLSEISEEALGWIRSCYPIEEGETTLSTMTLVNMPNEYGIPGFNRGTLYEDATNLYKSAEQSIAYYAEQGYSGVTLDMKIATWNQYKVADNTLNYIWTVLKHNLPEDEFNKLLEEQRAWNTEKEQKAKDAQAEYGDGTFGPVAYNDSLQQSTMERCKELIEHLK